MKMVKTKGCVCWPVMSRGKRQDLVTEDVTKSSIIAGPVRDTTSEGNKISDGQRRPTIPKEHDDFIEMLFPPGRHRSRTLATSLRSPKRRSDSGGGSVTWFRNRTNSLLSTKRYPVGSTDLDLFETVPATPESFYRDFSITLPLPSDRWSGPTGLERRRRTDVWPEYVWRLSQRRKQRCSCAGCEDTCTRMYKHPMEHHLGSYFDNESYYNTVGEGGDSRRGRRGSRDYDRPRVKHFFRTEAELYDVPSSRPHGPVTSDRCCPKVRPSDRSNSAAGEFQTRPRVGSIEQSAVRSRRECSVENASECSVCGTCKRYDRPCALKSSPPEQRPRRFGMKDSVDLRCFSCELKLETTSEEWHQVQCYEPRFLLDPCYGDSGYIQSDKHAPMQSVGETVTPPRASLSLCSELNCVIPSGMYIERNNKVRCHDNDVISFEETDYLTPLNSDSKRFQGHDDKVEKIGGGVSERYLTMNIAPSLRDPNWSEGKEANQSKMETKKMSQSDFAEGGKEKESLIKELSSEENSSNRPTDCESEKRQELQNAAAETSSSPRANDKSIETVAEGGGAISDSEEKRKICSLINENEVRKPESRTEAGGGFIATEALADDGRAPPGNKESGVTADGREASVRPRAEAAPPLRSRSQLDLLLMSPPPQCSFMVEHSYVNVSNPGVKSDETATLADGKDRKISLEQPCKQREEMSNKGTTDQRHVHCSIENNAEEISTSKSSTAYKYFPPSWQDVNAKKSGSPYVMLYKKAKHGNDYCHTYLPTLRENLMNICRSN